MKRTSTAIGLGVALLASPQPAQSLEPLTEMLAAGVNDSYIGVRCAGLLAAMRKWLKNDFTEDQLKNFDFHADVYLWAAITTRAGEDPSDSEFSAAAESIVNEIETVQRDFFERFEDNNTRTGELWKNDSLVHDDLERCKRYWDLALTFYPSR